MLNSKTYVRLSVSARVVLCFKASLLVSPGVPCGLLFLLRGSLRVGPGIEVQDSMSELVWLYLIMDVLLIE